MGVGGPAGLVVTPPAMLTVESLDRCVSAAYDDFDDYAVTVVVATHQRASLLPGLVRALEAQTAAGRLEVVIADDGSTDETWPTLTRLAATTPLPLLALRLPACGGPSVPRNTAIAAARAAAVAMTDDDCLPDPQWAEAILTALDEGSEFIRGPVRPADEPHGAWDRSIDVAGETPWFETANLGVDRAAFVAAGGFPRIDLLAGRRGVRGFGEDVLFGRQFARQHPPLWVESAVVRHRWLPGRYRDYLSGQWRVVGFPALVRESPALREQLWHGYFLSPRSAATDLALLGLAATAVAPWAAAAVLPWAFLAWPDARRRSRGRAPLRLAQLALGDLVTAAALVEGSVRARRFLL